MAISYRAYRTGAIDVYYDNQLFGKIEQTADGHHFRSNTDETTESFATIEKLKDHLESFGEL